MISLEEARCIALAYIEESGSGFTDVGGLVLLHEHTIETLFAWIFFYNSKKYVETGDFSNLVIGHGPLFISKSDGQTEAFGSEASTEVLIEMYEEMHTCWRLEIRPTRDMQSPDLLLLKSVLGLTLKEVQLLRATYPIVLDKGAVKRLEGLKQQLTAKGIDTVISPNND